MVDCAFLNDLQPTSAVTVRPGTWMRRMMRGLPSGTGWPSISAGLSTILTLRERAVSAARVDFLCSTTVGIFLCSWPASALAEGLPGQLAQSLHSGPQQCHTGAALK